MINQPLWVYVFSVLQISQLVSSHDMQQNNDRYMGFMWSSRINAILSKLIQAFTHPVALFPFFPPVMQDQVLMLSCHSITIIICWHITNLVAYHEVNIELDAHRSLDFVLRHHGRSQALLGCLRGAQQQPRCPVHNAPPILSIYYSGPVWKFSSVSYRR